MNFLLSASPFWDRLFYFLPVRDQVSLMLVCRQLRSIGNLSRQIQHRLILFRNSKIMKNRSEIEKKYRYVLGESAADYWAKMGNLERLLPEERTIERCRQAMHSLLYNQQLMYVPVKYRTRELYLYALTRRGDLISQVPWELRDEEMYLTAIGPVEDVGVDGIRIVHQIPPIHQTPKIVEAMVKKWPESIYHVAPHLITPELSLLAAQKFKHADWIM